MAQHPLKQSLGDPSNEKCVLNFFFFFGGAGNGGRCLSEFLTMPVYVFRVLLLVTCDFHK